MWLIWDPLNQNFCLESQYIAVKTRFVDLKLHLLDSAVLLDYANYFQFTGDSDYLFSSFFIAMIAYIRPILIGNCCLSLNNLKIITFLIAQGNFFIYFSLITQLLLINFAFRSFVLRYFFIVFQ